MDSSDAKRAVSSRRLLFWVVIGVIVLNILLFLKFGVNNRRGESRGGGVAVEPATNGHSKP
jgi:hypothetical protein